MPVDAAGRSSSARSSSGGASSCAMTSIGGVNEDSSVPGRYAGTASDADAGAVVAGDRSVGSTRRCAPVDEAGAGSTFFGGVAASILRRARRSTHPL